MPPNTFDPESAGIPARVTVGEEHAGKDASAPRRFMDDLFKSRFYFGGGTSISFSNSRARAAWDSAGSLMPATAISRER